MQSEMGAVTVLCALRVSAVNAVADLSSLLPCLSASLPFCLVTLLSVGTRSRQSASNSMLEYS